MAGRLGQQECRGDDGRAISPATPGPHATPWGPSALSQAGGGGAGAPTKPWVPGITAWSRTGLCQPVGTQGADDAQSPRVL